jgi:hypothetical protein
MASFFTKITRFAGSPQGRRAVQQAKELANDPRRRQQAKDAVDKVRQQLSGKRRPR